MRSHDDSASDDEQEKWDRAGTAFEAAGLMKQADYNRLARLSKDVASGDGSISDTNLEWALALLVKATEPVVRSKVMVLLSILGHSVALSQTQNSRIEAAVAPLLQSEHKLDQLSASLAMGSMAPRSPQRLPPPSDN
jgi:hypothetical protein